MERGLFIGTAAFGQGDCVDNDNTPDEDRKSLKDCNPEIRDVEHRL